MSEKIYDSKGRWRSRTVAFRISEEEDAALNKKVALSGLSKQNYLIGCVLDHSVTVIGNPRVFKAFKAELSGIHSQLMERSTNPENESELFETIRAVADVLEKLASPNTTSGVGTSKEKSFSHLHPTHRKE